MVSPAGLEDSAAPGDRTGALIDSREFGGRGASKTAAAASFLIQTVSTLSSSDGLAFSCKYLEKN